MTAPDALKRNLAAYISARMTAGVEIHISGTTEEITPPLVGITDTGSEIHTEGATLMRGIYDIELDIELVTVPDETTNDAHSAMAATLWNIIADDLPPHLTGPNGLTLFDFRAGTGTLETDEGRRATRFECFAVACVES
jgi:hypothetical protein